MILLLLFCLSRRVPLEPRVVGFLRLLHTFCVATTKSYTVLLVPHIVFVFNNYNTFAVLTTNKLRLFTAVVLFYYLVSKQYRWLLRLHHQISHRKVQCIEYFTNVILFISLFITRTSRCLLLTYFAYILHWNNQNLHQTSWLSHCILLHYYQKIC